MNRFVSAVFFLLPFVFCTYSCNAASLLPKEITFPLPFASQPQTERGYVDIPLTDKNIIGKSSAIEITFECNPPEAVGNTSFYLRSGNGWYSYGPYNIGNTGDESKGKNRFCLTVNPAGDCRIEGKPNKITDADTIRFAVWRGSAVDATVKLLDIETVPFQILAIMPETTEGTSYTKASVSKLSRIGIPTEVILQSELNGKELNGVKVIILPLNGDLTAGTVSILKKYIENGGKIIAFYQLPAALKNTLGFDEGKWIKSPEGNAAFAEVRFVSDEVLPLEKMQQNSWNIHTAEPLDGNQFNAEVAAWWYDKSGKKTDYPALLLSSRGAFFTHILTDEDSEAKTKFLLSLIGYFAPSFLHQSAVKNWKNLFSVGDNRSRTDKQHKELETALISELKQRGFDLKPEFFQSGTDEKVSLKFAAKYIGLNDTLSALHKEAMQKYCASLQPKKPEFRAWWEHAGLGAYPGDWDRTMRELHEAGFNAVIPNFLWGGSANYASDVINRNNKYEKYGDQVEQAVKAGKKYGIEVHAWQVCWWLEGSPKEYIEKMQKEKRTQVSFSGEQSAWLCPSNPKNTDLECETLCELVRKYPDLTGIHFDYIRYPDGNNCFCNGCKERFEAAIGNKAANFPKDVRGSGEFAEQYEQWRCDNITKLVERVHKEAKAIRPNIKISAAVFSQYPACRKNIGQDWVKWVEKGYLDFICPMDYTENLNHFEGLIEQQQEYIAGKIPLYPGIGATAAGITMSPDRVAAEIEIVRKRNAPGFVIFNLNGRTIQNIPPMLKLGATRP